MPELRRVRGVQRRFVAAVLPDSMPIDVTRTKSSRDLPHRILSSAKAESNPSIYRRIRYVTYHAHAKRFREFPASPQNWRVFGSGSHELFESPPPPFF